MPLYLSSIHHSTAAADNNDGSRGEGACREGVKVDTTFLVTGWLKLEIVNWSVPWPAGSPTPWPAGGADGDHATIRSFSHELRRKQSKARQLLPVPRYECPRNREAFYYNIS